MPRPLPWLTAVPIAHRGLHDAGSGIIENTFAAAKAAIDGGFAIECDVRLAADGVMVFHDDTLDRLTYSSGLVAGKTTAELKKARFRSSEAGIPTFQEFLEYVDGRVALFVEIKADPWVSDASLAEQVVAGLAGYKGPVAVMSFSPRVMACIKGLAPGLTRGLVASRLIREKDRHGLSAFQRFRSRHLLAVPFVSPHFIAYGVNSLPAPAPALMRRLNLPLLTWTVRTDQNRETARKCADQIIFEGFQPGT